MSKGRAPLRACDRVGTEFTESDCRFALMPPPVADRAPPPLPAWSLRLRTLLRPRLEWAGEVVNFAAGRARDVRLGQAAASLTFTTMLSLVPLLAVLLALFTAFPLFAELRGAFERNVLRELLPEQYAGVILRYLNDFVTKAGRLTAVGLVFLFVTALAMVHTVDRALNDIWQVRQQRPLVQRLLVYWALLTLGPLVLGASVSASSVLLSISQGWTSQIPGGLRALLDYAPVVLSGLAFAAMYVVVPARRVAWGDALIGGFIAALAGELMKSGFSLYLQGGSVTGIYGAFAAAPLFLLWVYLSWFAILFGAAIAATLPRLRQTRFADEGRAGNRFITAAALLRVLLVARRDDRQGGRLGLDELSAAVRSWPEETESLLAELERMGYIARLEGLPARWLLTCDPATTTLLPVFSRLAVDPNNTLLTRGEGALQPWMARGMAAEWVTQPLERALDATRPPVG
jgi:membrane protein